MLKWAACNWSTLHCEQSARTVYLTWPAMLLAQPWTGWPMVTFRMGSYTTGSAWLEVELQPVGLQARVSGEGFVV